MWEQLIRKYAWEKVWIKTHHALRGTVLRLWECLIFSVLPIFLFFLTWYNKHVLVLELDTCFKNKRVHLLFFQSISLLTLTWSQREALSVRVSCCVAGFQLIELMQLALGTQGRDSMSSPSCGWSSESRERSSPRNSGVMTQSGAATGSLASTPQGGLGIKSRVANQSEDHFSCRVWRPYITEPEPCKLGNWEGQGKRRSGDGKTKSQHDKLLVYCCYCIQSNVSLIKCWRRSHGSSLPCASLGWTPTPRGDLNVPLKGGHTPC